MMHERADYDDLGELLRGVGAERSVAEVHGMLCGALGGPKPATQPTWMAEVLAGTHPRGEAARDCLDRLARLYEDAERSLADGEFRFAPLLPADEETLAARASALGEWCEGFLLGLSLGGLDERSSLSGDERELITDLAEIARIDPDAGDGEEDEQAYAELVEYVRVAVLTVSGGPDGGDPGGLAAPPDATRH